MPSTCNGPHSSQPFVAGEPASSNPVLEAYRRKFGNNEPASFFTEENCLAGTREGLPNIPLLSQQYPNLALPAPPQVQFPEFTVTELVLMSASYEPSEKDVANAKNALDRGAVGGSSLALLSKYGQSTKDLFLSTSSKTPSQVKAKLTNLENIKTYL